jgi:hypothetical protein
MSKRENGGTPRNPLAGPNRRVNVPKVEPDRTKYRRRQKHKRRIEE